MKGTRADQGQRLAACPVSTLTARYDRLLLDHSGVLLP